MSCNTIRSIATTSNSYELQYDSQYGDHEQLWWAWKGLFKEYRTVWLKWTEQLSCFVRNYALMKNKFCGRLEWQGKQLITIFTLVYLWIRSCFSSWAADHNGKSCKKYTVTCQGVRIIINERAEKLDPPYISSDRKFDQSLFSYSHNKRHLSLTGMILVAISQKLIITVKKQTSWIVHLAIKTGPLLRRINGKTSIHDRWMEKGASWRWMKRNNCNSRTTNWERFTTMIDEEKKTLFSNNRLRKGYLDDG